MPSIAITDLSSLPTWVTSSANNNHVYNTSGRFYWNITVNLDTETQGSFENGQIFALSLTLNSLSTRYFRIYARAHQAGTSQSSSGTAGYLHWLMVPEGGFFKSGGIGSDANNGYFIPPAMAGQTFIFRFAFANLSESYIASGINIYIGSVNYDGSAGNANIDFTYHYLYGNYTPPTDPYDPIGPSEPGGGEVPWTLPDEPIDFPTLPTVGAYNAGLVSIWTPTEAQIRTFAAWLWNTDPTTWGFWQKLISNPLDLIFGLSILPIPVTHPSPDPQVLTLGWINTHCTMDYIDQQFIEVNMGTCDVAEYGGTYMDYVPYTKLSLYLPYIGVKEISANDCMGKTLSIHYNIDVVSGACIALVKADDKVLYHYMGNCAVQIPLSAVQMQDVVRNVISTAISVGVAATGAGAAATAAGVVGAVNSSVDAVMSGPDFSRSGQLGSNAGILDLQFPYLIRTTPRLAIPDEQNKYTGYPSFITEQLGDLEGYTEVEIIHLHNLTCTDEEAREIDSLLREGVIF